MRVGAVWLDWVVQAGRACWRLPWRTACAQRLTPVLQQPMCKFGLAPALVLRLLRSDPRCERLFVLQTLMLSRHLCLIKRQLIGLTWPCWPVCACNARASLQFTVTTARQLGAPTPKHHSFSRTAGTLLCSAPLGAWLLASGWIGADSAAVSCFQAASWTLRALFLCGAPIR